MSRISPRELREVAQRAMQPNLVDRVVGYFSPARSVHRIRARGVLATMSYVGASTSRAQTKNWQPRIGSADSDTLYDLPTLRARSRDAVRNQPIPSGAFNTALTETIGTGFRLKSTIDRHVLGLSEEAAQEWEQTAERIFRIASRQLDITRRKSWHALHQVELHSKLESGDVLLVRRMHKRPGDLLATKLQLVEADRVSNPDMKPDEEHLVGGVESDAFGAPIAFHVQSQHPGDFRAIARDLTWTKVPAFGGKSGERLAWLSGVQRRPGQTRGVPWLAPVMEALKEISDFSTAELHAAVVNSLFVVIAKSALPAGSGDMAGLGLPEDAKDDERSEYKLGSGLFLAGAPGDDFQIVDPKRPNANFGAFVTEWLKLIGSALGIPSELILKHFSASFSASQASMLQAHRFFSTWQQDEVDDFCQPVYELVLAEAVARGLLDAPGFFDDVLSRAAWSRAKWIGPGRGLIRPDVEVKASAQAVSEGFSTIEDEAARIYGSDWEQLHEQRTREHRLRAEAGLVAPLGGSSSTDNDGGDL